MKYLCLIYSDEKVLEETPADLVRAVGKRCLDHIDELKKSGQLITFERLESVQTATTVRTRDGKVTVTDGPFAEGKEQLAGFYLIDARDLNEAIRIASRIPPGGFGCVEVRPVMTGPES